MPGMGKDGSPLSEVRRTGAVATLQMWGAGADDLAVPVRRGGVEGGTRRGDGAGRRSDRDIEEWKELADAAIGFLASVNVDFVVDDVWKLLDDRGVPRPREGRAMGPRMMAAHRRGCIEPTDRFVATEQVKSHGSPIRIWRSRIYREETR